MANFEQTNKKDAEIKKLWRKLAVMQAKRFYTLEDTVNNQRTCKELKNKIGEMTKEANLLWTQEA